MDDFPLSVAVTLGIFFSAQLGTAIWWGSKISARVDHLAKSFDEWKDKLEMLMRKGFEFEIRDLKRRVASLETEKWNHESLHPRKKE